MISEKLFAHIHNDSHLVGTRNLEGLEFQSTVEYLFKYVEMLRVNTNDEKQLKKIEALFKKIENLKIYTADIARLRVSCEVQTLEEVKHNSLLNSITSKILSNINSINPSQKKVSDVNGILMPGGWQNGSNGGHVIIYEFKYDSDGNLIFLLHNTGAGLNFHHKIQQIDKDRYCPIKAYKIPKDSIDTIRLQKFIEELIIPQLSIKGVPDTSAEEIYNEVFSKIAYLNGEEVSPYKFTKQDNLTAGQRSGTCAERSLHQMIENEMPSKKAYRKFIYEFKKYSLEEYINKVKSDQTINEPGVRNQICLAIENMARALLKKDFFDEEKKNGRATFIKEKVRRIFQGRDFRA